MITRLIAIGDLHGEYTLLTTLIQNLQPGHGDRLVFLGDYIDRGEDSPKTVEFLRHLSREVHCVFLRGNHEDLLLDRLLNTKAYPAGLWEQNGGGTTLLQYGGKVPVEHLGFFMTTWPLYAVGPVLFVHAGLHPDKALKDQRPQDLFWIREPFLSSDKDFGALVVHGHTITDEPVPEMKGHRLNLDTGAFKTGVLSCAIFTFREDQKVDLTFAQARKDGAAPTLPPTDITL